jgi:hypothetical protein
MDTTEQPANEPVETETPETAQDAPEPAQADDADDAETRGEPDVEPAEAPEGVVSDSHTGPLDDDEDARFLPRDDERRKLAEQRRGRPFDEDEEAESGEQAEQSESE